MKKCFKKRSGFKSTRFQNATTKIDTALKRIRSVNQSPCKWVFRNGLCCLLQIHKWFISLSVKKTIFYGCSLPKKIHGKVLFHRAKMYLLGRQLATSHSFMVMEDAGGSRVWFKHTHASLLSPVKYEWLGARLERTLFPSQLLCLSSWLHHVSSAVSFSFARIITPV